jgi:hypothetical protein
MKFKIYGIVTGSKYIGEVEAESKEEAIEKAWELEELYVSVCHQCVKEIEDPEIRDIQVEESN